MSESESLFLESVVVVMEDSSVSDGSEKGCLWQVGRVVV